MVRVLLADDHPVFAAGLRTVLEAEPDIDVTAVAANGQQAVAEAMTHRPDVAVLDITMPEGDGLWVCAQLRAAGLSTRVLMLTICGDHDAVLAALRAGAHGYTLKDAGPDEIVAAVRAVARGEAVLGAGVAAEALAHFARAAVTTPFPQLTDREHEILRLIAGGLDNASVARRLGLSPKTVRNNVSNIIAKLHVPDRAGAILRAREAGLTNPPR
jgi:DNA-binding NarL/FixJ family response regulator